MHKRKILVITGSRGEYGYIRPLLRMISTSSEVQYSLVVTNMHLLPEFGLSESQIVADGLRVDYRTYNTLAGYNSITMCKSLGLLLIQLPEIVADARPDIILISGDRGEMLVSAMVGCHMNIPVAHIQAGEISGNVDGIVRHAITKLSHVHFASNNDAYNRVLNLGEQSHRVFNVGAPLVDEIINSDPVDVRNLYNLGDESILLYIQHPVTEEIYCNYKNACIVLDVINQIAAKMRVIVICPNSDAGSLEIRKAITEKTLSNYMVFENLPRHHYIGFLKESAILVGNSSSGIMEAPSCGLPTVNVGRRQIGRLQSNNVINCDYSEQELSVAINWGLSDEFKKSLLAHYNPYGDGKSSQRILNILRDIVIDNELINKKITY